MAQTVMITHPQPSGPGVDSVGHPGGSSLFTSVVLFSSSSMSQGRLEEKQLASCIHQLFVSQKAQRRFADNPDAYIARLKVLPRVRAILGLMQAALLNQKMTQPEFSWWWGARDPVGEQGSPVSSRPLPRF